MFGFDNLNVSWEAVAALATVVGVPIAIWAIIKKDPARVKAKKIDGPVVLDSELDKSLVTGKVDSQNIQYGGKQKTVHEGDNLGAATNAQESMVVEAKKATVYQVEAAIFRASYEIEDQQSSEVLIKVLNGPEWKEMFQDILDSIDNSDDDKGKKRRKGKKKGNSKRNKNERNNKG